MAKGGSPFSSRTFLRAALAGWVALLAAGSYAAWRYEATPGTQKSAPARWPAGSRISFAPGRYNLIVFAHPQCPCTRATVGELAALMAESGGSAAARVLFVRPEGFDPGWERTDLWQTAAAIPGVTVAADPGGEEARRFGSLTSGQVVVYDAGGALVFAGGITAARGHAGDNAGRAAVVTRLAGRPAGGTTAVFGCPLFADSCGVGDRGGQACSR